MNIQTSFQHQAQQSGVLYLVPTPIGNLDDMTFRAIDTLKNVDVIAAEDTRHTQKLLNYFDIKTKKISFHEHNTAKRIPELMDTLERGLSIAQVSDAGMPSISDPGQELVSAAIEKGYTVVPLPGANAALTALIASGICPQPFYFHGFLPRKITDLKQCLTILSSKTETCIFYESPYRVQILLDMLASIWGGARQVTLARELTKRYETFMRGSIQEGIAFLKTHKEQCRGEYVVIVEGHSNPESLRNSKEWEELSLKEHVERIMESDHVRDKHAIKQVAMLRNISKREVYSAYHEL